MISRQRLRGRILGFVFGKYKLDDQAKKHLIKDEEYISGIEILHYNEIFLLITIIFTIVYASFAILIHPIFLLFLLPTLYFVYLGTELELIFLTSERIIIERRSLIEKTLRTSNVKSISVDQIALINYGRPPFQIPTLILGLLLLMNSIFGLAGVYFVDPSGLFWYFIAFLPISLYLINFGLRLTKRSIELSVIGVPRPIGIGRNKGAQVWFLEDLQLIIFERVHHKFHGGEEDSIILEFPLEFSGRAKTLIEQTKKPLQRKILKVLDEKNLSKKKMLELLTGYSKIEIDEAMRLLRRKHYIFYSRSMNAWCLNRNTIIEELKQS